jgi:hypothetical protein
MNTNLNKLRGLLYLYILIVFGDTLTFNNIRMGVTPGNLSLTFDRKNIDQSVALAKLSVPIHHLSLFRVPWRLHF